MEDYLKLVVAGFWRREDDFDVDRFGGQYGAEPRTGPHRHVLGQVEEAELLDEQGRIRQADCVADGFEDCTRAKVD